MKKAIVIDLDGTLFNTNTFEKYIIFVCICALRNFDFYTAFSLPLLVILRKIRLISTHERLKYLILKSSKKYSNEEKMQELVKKLRKFENSKVVALMGQYRSEGYSMMLSTAAPEVYAKIVASSYGFDCYRASEIPLGKDWRENVNKRKRDNTLNSLKENGCELSVLITDHYDDLPLLSMPKELNYVVNPSQKTLQQLYENNIIYKLL